MSKIKTTKQFKERVDAAFATMQTRDPTEAAVAGRPPYRATPQDACCYAISSGFSIKSIRLM